MRRIEGQAPGRRLPQVDEKGGVHHGNGEAASAVSLPDGDVGRGALVVALLGQGGQEALSLYTAECTLSGLQPSHSRPPECPEVDMSGSIRVVPQLPEAVGAPGSSHA